ncbi:hypothetical protein Pla52n_14960 [Stieleria varia]|uniref:Uncharacterized protein n=1 Tax=Stieleria varia TaxID=2528005 RepID=A0A5C6B2M0_9BACT|nr:hypothetical protein Pla52n_14960 [Stieleria varia]
MATRSVRSRPLWGWPVGAAGERSLIACYESQAISAAAGLLAWITAQDVRGDASGKHLIETRFVDAIGLGFG